MVMPGHPLFDAGRVPMKNPRTEADQMTYYGRTRGAGTVGMIIQIDPARRNRQTQQNQFVIAGLFPRPEIPIRK